MRARLIGLVMGLTVGMAVTVIAQSWTAPRTWSDGETVTASLLNTHIRDNSTVLRAGGVAIASQGANEMIYASSATQLARSASLTFDGTTVTAPVLRATGGASALAGQIQFASNTLVLVGGTSGFSLTNSGGGGLMTLTGSGALTLSAQPGFLAYNSADDTAQSTGATVDFDTEVYDEATNFSADTFTAPVTGRYLLCAAVRVFDATNITGASGQIVTSNRTYQIGAGDITQSTGFVSTGCVHADMDAADTASVTIGLATGTITIDGGATVTYFSGRLAP